MSQISLENRLRNRPLADGSHVLTSTVFKLEIPLEGAPAEVKSWLLNFAKRELSPRREVVGVGLMVKYKTQREAF